MAITKVPNISPKPPSNIYKGYGMKAKDIFHSTTIDSHILRDNFTISTWILIGASLQCLLLTLPIRPSYTLLPALTLLAYRFINWILQCIGFIPHHYADGVIPGKISVAFPETYNEDGKKHDGGICVIMLTARCHSPLGLLAPHWEPLSARMQSLIHNLESSSPHNGFLGGNSWLNTSDRTSSSEVMVLAYFKTHDDLQAFAHGKDHRENWDWWNGLTRMGKTDHISITHEVYCARKGEWEGIYINLRESCLPATRWWVQGKEGEQGKWQSPVVRGNRYRSAMGRMGKSEGGDNEVYGEEPYEEV